MPRCRSQKATNLIEVPLKPGNAAFPHFDVFLAQAMIDLTLVKPDLDQKKLSQQFSSLLGIKCSLQKVNGHGYGFSGLLSLPQRECGDTVKVIEVLGFDGIDTEFHRFGQQANDIRFFSLNPLA